DSASTSTNVDITAQTGIASADIDSKIVPGYVKTIKKTDTEKVVATGQRDDGTKATGKLTLQVTDCAQSQVTVPAGTTVSANGLNFITQSDVTLETIRIGNKCRNSDFPDVSSGTVSMTASSAGDKYNLAAQTYAVAGFSNVTSKGSDTTGGTSKITQIVSQTDVDNAKQKILDRLNAAATSDFKSQFSADNITALTDTLSSDEPAVASTPNVNDPGSEVTVSLSANFSQMGVKLDDLKKIVEVEAKKSIDTSKQAISDYGLANAVFRVSNKSATSASFNLQTLVKTGPQLDANNLKKEIAGKKRGEIISSLESRPGITNVEVKYSPFWVHSTPKNIKHITIIFDKPNEK
ncbi:MAG: hypothetical protein ABI354_03020, partial [Candidatus Saccharimonadales bacterium]